MSLRLPGVFLLRLAERALPGLLFHAAANDWAGQAFTTRRKAERQKTLRERAARARKTTAGSADSKGVKASRFKG